MTKVFGFLFLTSLLFSDPVEEIFTQIYDKAIWGIDTEEYGTSGPGSSLENTSVYRSFLASFLKFHGIGSVIDIGCGDWNFSKEIDWNGLSYVGIDIVKPLIEKNQSLYGAENISFLHANFIEDAIPKADLLICKEVLQHLSNEQILNFLPKIRNYPYCLFVNDVDPATLSSQNDDTSAGGYRTLDLTQPPFNLKGKRVLIYKAVTSGGYYHTKQVLLVKNR